MTKHILITGGCGFIGFHLARKLATDPDNRIVLLDNHSRHGNAHMPELAALAGEPNVEIESHDLRGHREYSYEMGTRRFDEIYHLAAINGTKTFYERPADVLRTNLETLMTVLDYASGPIGGRPKVLFASSNEAYAGLEAIASLPIPTPENVPLVIDDPKNPRWSYGGSKLAGELLVHAYAAQHGVPAVIIRPHNFYGPLAGNGHVIPQMIARIRAREDPFKIYGADQTRSFCYIDDAVDAIILAMSYAGVPCPTFHIGTQAEIPMHALAHLLFDICKWTPERVERCAAPPGSVSRRCPDVGLMASLGWRATTSLPEGLRATALWYLARPA